MCRHDDSINAKAFFIIKHTFFFIKTSFGFKLRVHDWKPSEYDVLIPIRSET